MLGTGCHFMLCSATSRDYMWTVSRSESLLSHSLAVSKVPAITGKAQHFQSHPVSFYDCKPYSELSQPTFSLSFSATIHQPSSALSLFQLQVLSANLSYSHQLSSAFSLSQPQVISANLSDSHQLSSAFSLSELQVLSANLSGFHQLSSIFSLSQLVHVYFQPTQWLPSTFIRF
jgi:hypothetical protein